MTDDRPLLEHLVVVSRRDLADGDRDQRHQVAGRSLFDTLVCIASGAQVADPVVVPDESGPVPLIGTNRSGGLLGAIAANASAAHRRDLDDIHWPSVTHPGSVVWPALLAFGAAYQVPLARLREAAAFGYQVCARMAGLLGSGHRARFHASTTAGTVGVAAAVATVRDLDDDALLTSLLHACSTLGGTAQALRERSRTAVVHRGVAATTGTLAALQTTTAPAVAAPLTGEHGMCAATGTTLDVDNLEVSMAPVVENLTVRCHPVTGFAHTLVDAILDAGPFAADEVDAIDAEVPGFTLALSESAEPVDARTAAWSLPHAAALAVAGELAPAGGGVAGPSAEAHGHRPAGRCLVWPPRDEVEALRARVRLRPRDAAPPELGVAGVVTLADGGERRFARSVPRGHPDDPLTDAELVAKGVRLDVIDQADAEALLAVLVSAGSDPLTSAHMAMLRAPGSGRRR